MQRIRWTYSSEYCGQVAEAGRFIVRTGCRNPKWWGYWSLTDATTGEEFPCRTEASAKAAARNILTKGRRA